MRIRSILYLVTFIASCVGLWFLVDRFSGSNERSQSEEEVGDGDLAQQVAVRRSRNLDSETRRMGLSLEELARGFQLVANSDGESAMLVHPNSPCWIELPTPQASTLVEPTPHSYGFQGAEACMPCHKEYYRSFVETSHYQASQAASSASILGSFAEGENRLETNHPDLSFTMTQDSDGSFYQNVHLRSLTRRVRFGIVTGSGNLAQTYLFWDGEGLFQMHVSYYTKLNRWINSPGYNDGTAWYTRETIPKCVECHMTYMEPIPETRNRFNRAEVIFGVTCERCHGPGSEHVAHHRQYPGDRKPLFIANPAKLSRQAMNDVCAQCHLGSAEPLQRPFSFRPGDKLDEFWKATIEVGSPQGNVHSSNQLQRLKMSKCFTGSQMTCIDCHDPHRNERGNIALFSQRCIRCHPPEQCGTATRLGGDTSSNCIDCHMGMGYDNHIQMQTVETIHMPLLRDHNVRLLPEATQRFIERLSKNRSAP